MTAFRVCIFVPYPLTSPPPPLGRAQGFCAMCELQCHIQRVMNQSGGMVRPVSIVQNLRGEAAVNYVYC